VAQSNRTPAPSAPQPQVIRNLHLRIRALRTDLGAVQSWQAAQVLTEALEEAYTQLQAIEESAS